MESDLVIKVRYGDTLRRFNASVGENSVDLNITGLRKKILSLFSLSPEANLTLTYVDEDNDVVQLVNDEDLRDVAVVQRLNPLRINVTLKGNQSLPSDTQSQSGISTPSRPAQIQSRPASICNGVEGAYNSVPAPLFDVLLKLSNDLILKAASTAPAQIQSRSASICNGVEEAFNSVPAPLFDVLIKLSNDLILKAASSEPVLNELVEYASKFGLTTQGSPSLGQDGRTHLTTPSSSQHTVNPASTALIGIPKEVPDTKNVVDHTSVKKSEELICNAPSGKGPSLPTAVGLNLNFPGEALPSVLTCVESSEHQRKGEDIHNSEPNAAVDHLVDLNSCPSQASEAPKSSVSLTQDGGEDKHASNCLGKHAPLLGFCPWVNETNSDPFGAVSPCAVPQFGKHPFKRTSSHHDSTLRTFHKGVLCDGCGMFPIVGPRFKSRVKEDTDLCNICFSVMGNVFDYTHFDCPRDRASWLFKGFPNSHLPPFQNPPARIPSPKLMPFQTTFDSRFIQDVTVLDGTTMKPNTPFTKIWRMLNNGAVAWPPGTQLVWIGGDHFGRRGSVALEEIPSNGCPVNEEFDISFDFIAPSRPGRYISYWTMASPLGQIFGQHIWVLIHVDDYQRDFLPGSLTSFYTRLNLNLPPEGSSSEHKERVIDMNAVPTEGVLLESENSNVAAEHVKPLVHEHLRKQKIDTNRIDMNVAPTESVLLESENSNVAAEHVKPLVHKPLKNQEIDTNRMDVGNETSASVSYPIVDLPEQSSAPTAEASSREASPQASSREASPRSCESVNPVEKTLLKELEEMGFKQVDLNKEVLRINEYNLEKSLDDLCCVAEWDPMLEELQEMGFSDRQMNKKLLIKNGGSIKRVVLDLIMGETTWEKA